MHLRFKQVTSTRLNAIISIAACALLTGATATFSLKIQAQVTGASNSTTPRRGEPITLNFSNAEIESVARTMATVTGRNVVVDPRVKGTMTLTTDTPVAPAVAYNQFLATLRMQGYTVVQADGLDKVVPEADAKLQGGSVSLIEAGGAATTGVAGNQLATQIIRLQYENANNLVAVLRPLISPNNPINVNPGNNSLVITDYADNLRRLARIVAALDVPNATDVEIIALKNANASDLAPLVLRLLEASSGAAPGGTDASFKTTIVAEPRSNTLILRAANQARLALAKSLIDKLDQPSGNASNGAAGNIYVVYLKNANATTLATTLRAALSGEARATPAMSGIGGVGTAVASASTAAGASTGGQIQADAATNSLIITAPEPQYRQLKSLIDKLDQPSGNATNGAAGNIYVVYLKNANATQLATTLRAALSGEARATPAASGMGASSTTLASASTAAGAGASTGGQIQADAATNSLIITAPEPQYRQLRAVIDKLDARRAQVFVESLIAEVSAEKAAEFGIQWQGALGKAGDGVIGLLGTNFGSGGKNILNLATQGAAGTLAPAGGLNIGTATQTNGVYVLGALARFLETSGSGNVLSTPNLLTLDNEEAKITIGQNVPFVTGQFTNAGTANGTVNPFQTIERKDVGLTLKVKPQISENGTVKMAIFQEVSSVASTDANGPTTNKRTIETNVLVDDGSVVVLGGLLQDDFTGTQEKVPGLGDLPFFGALFKSEARKRKKTNLMVFLRPVVVRDASATDRLSNDRYEQMRTKQIDAQPEPSSLVPINDAPVMLQLQRSLPVPAPTSPADAAKP